MSYNDRLYSVKMAERREKRGPSTELRRDLDDIFETIRRCEAMWALEERIEKGR